MYGTQPMTRGFVDVKPILQSVGLLLALCAAAAGAEPAAPSEAAPPAAEAASPALPVAAPPDGQAPSEATSPEEGPKEDHAARMFMQKCAGCHTIGGGALTGPDLKAVQTWPRQNVDPAILRMEKNVGKLKAEDVQAYAELLLAPDAASRIAEERKRISMQEMAKLEPANAAVGEALFYGQKPFVNRGLACASCHAVSGRGGNLSLDLTGSFAKLGEVPLASTIEGVTFPLMQAAYADNPITKQESIHLVKYLEVAGAGAGPTQRALPLHAVGFLGAAAALMGMTLQFRKRNRGIRAELVRSATRRSRS